MSIITYDIAPNATDAAAPKSRRSLLRRVYDRLIEARMRHAEDVLKHHSHLIPRELEQVGWKISERSEDSLPFVR